MASTIFPTLFYILLLLLRLGSETARACEKNPPAPRNTASCRCETRKTESAKDDPNAKYDRALYVPWIRRFFPPWPRFFYGDTDASPQVVRPKKRSDK